VRDARVAKYNKLAKTIKKDSVEYRTLVAEIVAAQEVYDTTPKGIEELKEKVISQPEALTAMRYAKGKLTRSMQHEALKEIEIGRTESIAKIVSSFDPFFSSEEVESIIQSTRENREAFIIDSLSESMPERGIDLENIDSKVGSYSSPDNEGYTRYLDKMEENLNLRFNNEIPLDIQAELDKLKSLDAPTDINLHTYRSIGFGVEKGKKQLGNELSRISAIQDAPVAVVAEYFDAYRKEYNDKYSSMPADAQPNPPREWLEGELNGNGLTKNKTSNFIPRDPATVFAIYKMRTDLEAIPDFLKQSTKITAVDFDGDGYKLTQVSRSGKAIKKLEAANEEELSSLIVKSLNDSVILMPRVPESIYEKSDNKSRFISIADVAQKHFNFADVSSASIKGYLGSEGNTLALYSALRKKMLKTWSTKASRTNSEKLSFKPTGASRTITLVR
jgi:hypothetical protein